MSDTWIRIACHTLLEAITRAIDTTGLSEVAFYGDFGQDEGAGEVGMGNDRYSIVVWPNGTAILCVTEEDNQSYLASR